MRRRKDGEDAAQVAEDELNEHSELKHRDQGSQSIARIASLIFLVLAAGVGYLFYNGTYFHYNFTYNPDYFDTSPDIILLYEKHDVNADGKLDLREFKPLAERILNYRVGDRFLIT